MLFSFPMIAMFAWGPAPASYGPVGYTSVATAPTEQVIAQGQMTIVSDDENTRINRQWIEDAISPRPRIFYQVRIQQRIRIRIPRRASRGRQNLSSTSTAQSQKWKTRKIGKCISMNGISGVQISAKENRLVLYMRDSSVIRAELEKNCPARSFYSGFYLEQSSDGQLCIDRDFLLARSGQQCQLDKIRQLVPDDD